MITHIILLSTSFGCIIDFLTIEYNRLRSVNSALCFLSLEAGVRLEEPVDSPHLVDLLKTSTPSKHSDLELKGRRLRRSVFSHSGVRICSQESLDDILASHRGYYQLRGKRLRAQNFKNPSKVTETASL
uniref:Uncharacterized protein n=1 Tax=Nothobranchius furzeri TaxID=105023 RepID=A0A8C6PF84_NOTFU